MKPWISEKVSQLLGFEDEVLIGYVIGLLEEKVLLRNEKCRREFTDIIFVLILNVKINQS